MKHSGKVITVDSAKNLVTEYANRAGSLAAHLTTVVQEAGKIFAALPLEVSKFNNKEKEAVPPTSITYSITNKSYFIINLVGESQSLKTRRQNWPPNVMAE